MYGVSRDDITAQARLIYNDSYIHTPQLPLPVPTPTTSPTTHQPPPQTSSHGPYGRCVSSSPRPPDPPGPVRDRFTLPAVCCFVCAVWSACEGMASLDLPPPAFGRSVVRVGPCRSPNSWALFCGWVPPSAGLRFGRRKITNYKLQISNYKTDMSSSQG